MLPTWTEKWLEAFCSNMSYRTSRLKGEEAWIGKVCLLTFWRYMNWEGWMIIRKMFWEMVRDHILPNIASNVEREVGSRKLYGTSAYLWSMISSAQEQQNYLSHSDRCRVIRLIELLMYKKFKSHRNKQTLCGPHPHAFFAGVLR